LFAEGAISVESGELRAVDVVITMLSDGVAVEKVMLGGGACHPSSARDLHPDEHAYADSVWIVNSRTAGEARALAALLASSSRPRIVPRGQGWHENHYDATAHA
jgi:3-hydroxyisobutyrate dehydrogenase-like beta-hydroxyacid dehydrogenase